jgi:6-phosphogluconolactonase
MKKLVICLTLSGMLSFVSSKERPIRFLVGTTDKAGGIYFASLDPATGVVALTGKTDTPPSPGYIAFSPDKKGLFVVTGDQNIRSYRVTDDALHLVNAQSSEGMNPCHVSVLPSGKMAFVANYGDGSFSAYRIQKGFELSPAIFKDKYEGSGPNERRQEKPHAHCAVVSPDGKSVYVADLGTDKVMNYRVDGVNGTVASNPVQSYLSVKPGAGPRHLVVHPSGKWLFLLNELDATLTACSVDKEGVLRHIATYPTLPSNYKEPGNTSAAIRLHPNGKFVYVSNRGYDAIHGFRIEENGTLTKVTEAREQIGVPRDFNLDPSGRFMVVGNLKTNNLTVLRVDPKTGALSYQSTSEGVPSPSCIEYF